MSDVILALIGGFACMFAGLLAAYVASAVYAKWRRKFRPTVKEAKADAIKAAAYQVAKEAAVKRHPSANKGEL